MILFLTLTLAVVTAGLPSFALAWEGRNYPEYSKRWLVKGGLLFSINIMVAWLHVYFGLPALVGPLWGNVSYICFFTLVNAAVATYLLPIEGLFWPWSPKSLSQCAVSISLAFQLFWIWPTVDAYLIGRIGDHAFQQVGEVTEIEMSDALGSDIALDQQLIRRTTTDNSGYLAALKVADSEIEALKTLNTVGNGSVQMVNGELEVVHPLVYSPEQRFWKWRNSEGTLGYVRVSATDETKQILVEEVDGAPISMRYVPTALFGEDLKRYIWKAGFRDRRVDDISFHIDDAGRPFYVLHMRVPTFYWGASVPAGIIVVDPQTGAISEETPEWLERVISEKSALRLAEWNGKYPNGYWNWAKLGMSKPTAYGTNRNEMFFVPGKDGNFYWVTGMTSYSTGEFAADRIVTVDAVTGQLREFAVSGINEVGALDIAIDLYQPRGNRQAVQAIPYPIYGRLGYVVLIMADGKRLQEFVIVDSKSSKTGQGTNLAEALRNFAIAIGEETPEVAEILEGEFETASGTIESIADYVSQGETVVILTLEGKEQAFQGRASAFLPTLPLLEVGETVTIEYLVTEDLIAPIKSIE